MGTTTTTNTDVLYRYNMHSPLLPHIHPKCVAAIEALNKCHNEHDFLKFVGWCNTYKVQLRKCFEMERKDRMKENKQKSSGAKNNVHERLQAFKRGERPLMDAEEEAK